MSKISADSISSRSGQAIVVNNSLNVSGVITATAFYVGSTPLSGGSVSISTTPPTSPSNGQQWFDSDDGNTYIWYASQNAWVVSQTYGY